MDHPILEYNTRVQVACKVGVRTVFKLIDDKSQELEKQLKALNHFATHNINLSFRFDL